MEDKKMKHILKYIAAGVIAAMALTSCEDFLNRPNEDGYNTSNFYQTDDQLEQGVNYLYNSPWYDFQRGFIKVGEVMSGNEYVGGEPYMNYSVNGTDQSLVNMSYSLWAVNGHCNTVIKNILASQSSQITQAKKDQCIGEALTWKAFAYFYMVRVFGEVPIVHDNSELLGGEYNKVQKVEKADVYEYIIMTIEKALELLPKKTSGFCDADRIDYYGAEALLAKVYLTKAGVSGSLDQSDLKKAAELSKDVIDNSGRTLSPSFEQIFRLKDYNATGESLIAWQWANARNPWTQQNTLQSDLAMVGFSNQGDCWGGYRGMTIDLQDAFGVDVRDNPATRNNGKAEKDSRRKATMMMPGDSYDYFWTDKGGFDYLRFVYDKDGYGKGGPGFLQTPTGTNWVKHLYGDDYDHSTALNLAPDNMAYQLPTHLIRLSDVYLVYAEASLLSGSSDEALTYINKVRERAGCDVLESVAFEDIWKERRLELAGEGDRWFDYVRRAYYDMDACIAELKAMRRGVWIGIDDVCRKWVGEGFDYSGTWDASSVRYEGSQYDNPNVTSKSFVLPFPEEDVVFNKNMAADAEVIHVDVRAEYSYDF